MLRLLSPILLATVVVAQTTTQTAAAPANRFVPADSALVVRVAAPAIWGVKFQKTQAAKVMQTPHAKKLVDLLSKNFDAAIAALRESGTVDADLVEKLLTVWAGDLTFSVQVDWDDLATAMQEDRPPHFSVVCALSGDGAYDLTGLAASIQQFAEKEANDRRPLKDLTVGDVRLRIADNDGMQACLPTMIEGQLVMLLGTDLESNAARLLRNDKRYEGELPKIPLFLHANLDRLMATLIETIETQLDASGMMPFEMGPMLRKTGLAALGHLDLAIDAEDKTTVWSTKLGFGEGDLGFMAAMMGEGRPKLLQWLPAGCEQFSAQHLDLNVLYKTAVELWRDLGDVVPMTAEDAEAAFAENTKVRLKEDLLAHLGDEMLSFQGGEVGGEADEDEALAASPFAALGGTCFVLSLRDGKAFGKNLETALRSRGMHAARKSEDYADTKIYQLRFAGLIDVEYAVTDDMLLLVAGKGEAGRRNLRGVLDARKRGGESALPEAVTKHLAGLPDGWSALGVSRVDEIIASMTAGMNSAIDAPGIPHEVTDMFRTMRGIASDLRAAGIEPMVGATYVKGRVLESRARW